MFLWHKGRNFRVITCDCKLAAPIRFIRGILAGKLDSFGIDFVSVSDLPGSVISDYLLYFPIKVAGKLAEIPMRLILCDHVLNSRHQAVL